MLTILIMLVVIALIVSVAGVGLGFYRGWFKVSSRNDPSKANVTLSFDKVKIEADREQVVDQAQDLGHQTVDSLAAATRKA